MVVLEQALAYVCCSAEEGKTKVQRYCRKIYELGYVPICPQYSFSPFLDDGDAEDMQAMRRMSHQILRRCRMVVVCGKETTGTMNTEISMADRLHIICTTLDSILLIITPLLFSQMDYMPKTAIPKKDCCFPDPRLISILSTKLSTKQWIYRDLCG